MGKYEDSSELIKLLLDSNATSRKKGKLLEAKISHDELFLIQIADIVESNLLDSKFGITQLARKIFLSKSQLFRKIKVLTGRSTANYIRSIRLQKGREMLENTGLRVSEIAYKTGFNSPFYFSRTFSKEFGFTPSSLYKKYAL
jgi:AraC-like DNA-binding protein